MIDPSDSSRAGVSLHAKNDGDTGKELALDFGSKVFLK
jgi:hypothetical protein